MQAIVDSHSALAQPIGDGPNNSQPPNGTVNLFVRVDANNDVARLYTLRKIPHGFRLSELYSQETPRPSFQVIREYDDEITCSCNQWNAWTSCPHARALAALAGYGQIDFGPASETPDWDQLAQEAGWSSDPIFRPEDREGW